MPLPVTDIETLKAYINGVMKRADHHAGDVNEIALVLAGAMYKFCLLKQLVVENAVSLYRNAQKINWECQ